MKINIVTLLLLLSSLLVNAQSYLPDSILPFPKTITAHQIEADAENIKTIQIEIDDNNKEIFRTIQLPLLQQLLNLDELVTSYQLNFDSTTQFLTTEVKTVQLKKNQPLALTAQYYYHNNELIQKSIYQNNQLQDSIIYHRDKKNKIRKIDILNRSGKYQSGFMYSYKNDGNVFMQRRLNKQMELTEMMRYKYDKNGDLNIIEVHDHNLKYQFQYAVDLKEFEKIEILTLQTLGENNKLLSAKIIEKNDLGQIITSSELDSTKRVIGSYQLKYNDNRLSQFSYFGIDDVYTIDLSYHFNQAGYWTDIYCKKEDEVILHITRRILFF